MHCIYYFAEDITEVVSFGSWAAALNAGDEVTLYVEHQAHLSSVNDAWKYLLNEALTLAGRHGVNPEDFILSEL